MQTNSLYETSRQKLSKDLENFNTIKTNWCLFNTTLW